jgi:23S rRNA G2445 N2-methylase RlmL
MISVKDAVARAAEFAAGVLDEPRRNDLRLEEVERRDPHWLITLSMPSTSFNLGSLLHGASAQPRGYKTFTVDADTGEVLSMKIRELAGAS